MSTHVVPTHNDWQLESRPLDLESSTDMSVQPDTTDMPDELQERIPEYLRIVRQYTCEMSGLFESKNFDGIRSLAHNIKGTGGCYGLPHLTRLAGTLEASAKTADEKAIIDALLELTGFLRRVAA